MRNAELKWVVLAAVLATAAPAAAQTSLSIYADGRVVVRKTLPQALERGRNTVTLRLEGLDPATLFSPDSSVTVASAVVRQPSGKDDALRAAVGQTLSFVRDKGDTIRATVVRVDPPQYKLSDGRLLLGQPGEPLFPAGVVRTSPEATLVVEAARARPRTELAYVAQGAKWEALYQVVLGGRGIAGISGSATVSSERLRADSADVHLVSGSINRTRFPAEAGLRLDAVVLTGVAQGEARQGFTGPEERAVGETHVYHLPGKLTLEPGVSATTALFPRATVAYTQEFVVPGALPWRGWIGQSPEPNRLAVQVWYTLKRDRGSAFGRRPLPVGTVQLYQADSAGQVQLVGEATIMHTPAGRDVRVQSGNAFDVTVERVQTDFTQEQLPPPRRGVPGRQRLTAAYRVTITNAKTEAVTVDVREARYGMWRIVESSIPAEKLSATESRFRVPVPAGGEAVLTYTVQLES
ncbi:MAG: DUF4139 domain-containing protein [Gemmatimonadales bacterium]